MAFNEYAEYDGLGLAALVARKAVTPAELAEAAIARIEKYNPHLNAVVTPMYEQGRALAAAPGDGPFRGVPFLLKDILGNVAGVPTQSGARFLRDMIAPVDDTLVVRFKAAGLVPLGKTNVPEFGLLPTTESVLYGAAHNPWSLAHSTGGSSGGSAAAVAAGIVPFAHANDGGGSIRIPASCCGLVGLKPTRARNPLGPRLGDIMSGLICEHVVSRTVRDTAVLLDCTAGPEPGDPYAAPAPPRPYADELTARPTQLRIAYTTTDPAGQPLHPECVAAVEATARLCQELGHIVEPGAPSIDHNQATQAFLALWCGGLAMQIDAVAMLTGRAVREEDFEGVSWGLYQQGRQVTASQYLLSLAMLQIIGRACGQFHETYDCWLTPTLGTPPIALGTVDINQRDPLQALAPILNYVPFTPLQNATGQPAISLPLHWSADGLPVGVMFTAKLGDESTLLRLAAQLEQARPWKDKRPPLFG
ncbi:MAG: amidase family protein [Deltaproteobacteria bacterium]|nr:amidase family protein [Deltaproteobacteria bacterium]